MFSFVIFAGERVADAGHDGGARGADGTAPSWPDVRSRARFKS